MIINRAWKLARIGSHNVEMETLNWVNAVRIANGVQPLVRLPLGRRGNSGNCVIAVAFSDFAQSSIGYKSVNLKSQTNPEIWRRVLMPEVVGVFVAMFDQKQFEHLEGVQNVRDVYAFNATAKEMEAAALAASPLFRFFSFLRDT